MSERSANEAGPVSFGERLASSQHFTDLFRDGMALVEETASYLDGPGRQESKKLDRSAALAYATESMRLTTRLMQLASWLLLHRAVKEGEMSLAQANKEKAKVKLSAGETPATSRTSSSCRSALRALIERSRTLQLAVRRLDATMHASRGSRSHAARQPGRAAAWPAQGGIRARVSGAIRLSDPLRKTKPPLARGLCVARQGDAIS